MIFLINKMVAMFLRAIGEEQQLKEIEIDHKNGDLITAIINDDVKYIIDLHRGSCVKQCVTYDNLFSMPLSPPDLDTDMDTDEYSEEYLSTLLPPPEMPVEDTPEEPPIPVAEKLLPVLLDKLKKHTEDCKKEGIKRIYFNSDGSICYPSNFCTLIRDNLFSEIDSTSYSENDYDELVDLLIDTGKYSVKVNEDNSFAEIDVR